MKTKKLLSILLALMMMLSVVPMYASAADPIALTEANITTYPTANGEIWFGQKISDGITLTGGEVKYDGVVVAGHFEFINPDFVPEDANDAERASIKFVPNDESTYLGFSISRSRNVTFTVKAVTPVFIDDNDLPVASEVEAGAKLSTSEITGGAMKNPYVEDEPNIAEGIWEWTSRRTVINESGYYEAEFVAIGYEIITREIYVKVAGEAVATTITEAPTASLTYDGVTTWADVELTGGKAMSGDTEVAGKFTIDNAGSTVIEAGTYTLNITFTPDDTENYLPSTGTATVTVNPAPIKFVDENGAECVPEITVPYGTKLGDRTGGAGFLLNSYINLSGVLYNINFVDSEGNTIDKETIVPVGTNEYKVKISTDNKNYENAELTCKFTVEPIVIEINGAGYRSATNELYAYIGKTNIPGTFDIFVDGELVGDDLALTYDTVTCPWTPTETGEHTIKVVYNAVNENYVIADYEKAFTAKVQRTLTYDGYIMLSVGFRENATTAVMGDLVTIKPVLEDFAVWVITDANGNEVTLEGVDLTSREITFSMPDHDVKISFKTNTQLEQEEAAANCDHICHSDNPLFQILWKVLTFIFRLFDVQQYCDCGNLHYDAPLFG